MPNIVARPIFKRHLEFVAVKQFTFCDLKFKPGDSISKTTFRSHHIRSLFMRRKIGPVGHAWTEAMLAGVKHPELTDVTKKKAVAAKKKKPAPPKKNNSPAEKKSGETSE